MQRDTLNLLVISDLHCHRFDKSPADSILLAGAPRRPIVHHPMESLFNCIEVAGLNTDCIIAPGDFADKVCQIGFGHAWQLLEELSFRLGGVPVVPALGNHDVDSRKLNGTDPFKIARYLSPRFPFIALNNYNEYFAQGFSLLEISDTFEIIAVNSVIDHYDEPSAKKGTFDPNRIAALTSSIVSQGAKHFRIALMHHHPLLHSSPILSDEDVLSSGDQLLTVLSDLGCSLVIHGHKHHPRLTYVDTTAGRLPVFAAGSFSALLKELASRTRNVFHFIELECCGPSRVAGRIRSWEWRQGEGWVPSSLQSSDFPHVTGFGALLTIEEIKKNVQELAAREKDRWLFEWQDIRACGAPIDHLTPGEFGQLAKKLEEVDLRLEARGEGFEVARLYSPEKG